MSDGRATAWWEFTREECPDRADHRWPQGPNEDVSICGMCGSGTYMMRPEGETFGDHEKDCVLPPRHRGFCSSERAS
jgi:hypothetical protein